MTSVTTGLNEQQLQAVLNSYDKNTILVAGAGSGKTKTLQERVRYLLEVKNVQPSEIMVITFTNKAAGEIKRRLASVTEEVDHMWVGTFHAICVRILKDFGSEIGIKRFTIMDTGDVKQLIRTIMNEYDLKSDIASVNQMITKISNFKSNLLSPNDLINQYPCNLADIDTLRVYQRYQAEKWERKVFDFDDLVVYTVRLLEKSELARDWFHNTINYVMVDESQDTNSAQFVLVKLLVGDNNLFMVGDDDQSIYSFRNAKPEYLINFAQFYPNSQVMKLERNYRSTGYIVEASNAVIKENTVRTDKTMFTENKKGNKIVYHRCKDSREEAEWVANEIVTLSKYQGISYQDQAILYRTNAQSRLIEEYLIKLDIPYTIVGGLAFYERKEVKDILAFYKFKADPTDAYNFKRVMALVPKIGAVTIQAIVDYAKVVGCNYLEALDTFPFSNLQRPYVQRYVDLIKKDYPNLHSYAKEILKETSIVEKLKADGSEESWNRIDNIKELISIMIEQEINQLNITIQEFASNITLRESEEIEDQTKGVTLMTIHSSKGLEYDYVFLIGVEEGVLPHRNSLMSTPMIEEERRLMYVGMTRAKKQLYITTSEIRLEHNGKPQKAYPSRFLSNIPKDCLFIV